MSKPISISWVIVVVLTNMLVACATETPTRINAYLGALDGNGSTPGMEMPQFPEGSIQAGLLVINDTTAPGSAPSLAPETLTALTEGIRVQIMQAVPITFEKVLDNNGVTPNGNPQEFVSLAKKAGVSYLMLAILSSNESEVPTYLPINGIIQGGGGRSTVPGYEAQNFSLCELALLEGKTGRPVIQAHGRAWSTLYRLNVPTDSNAYPVVVRAQLYNPIFPRGNNAHDTLRGIAGDDAIKQGVMHLRLTWKERFST